MSAVGTPAVRFPALVALSAVLLLVPSSRSLSQSTSADTTTASAPGGFLESASTGIARPSLAASVIQSFLPARGPFTFPAPYNTAGIRITNASDCGGGDCLNYVGYSYWRNINNNTGNNQLLVFLGLDRQRGGAGPSLFSVDKTTGQVTNLGPLFSPSEGRSWHSTEGWYWSMTKPTKIYVDDNSRMLRYDVNTHQYETVFDVAPQFGADKIVWQMHSSDDDRVHSATLRTNTTYEMLGCVVYHEDTKVFQYFPKIGDFNECSVDKSGRWLMSLEDVDYQYDLEMRIFNLATGTERLVWDQDGAVGHADMGFDYVVGADNWNAYANAILRWDFVKDPLSGFMVFHDNDWSAPAANHIAHGNARSDIPASQQFACGSGASRVTAVWGNEIVCFPLDGSLKVLVVAPVMTDMDAAGGRDDYGKEPKGNLDNTGQYFIWTSNMGGPGLDAFIVKVPSQLIMGAPTDTTPPTVSLTGPAAGASLTGPVTVSASASDNVGVAGVQFRVDGANVGSEETAAPWSVAWNTAGWVSGPHTLTAVARDAAGNVTTSAAVTVTVANDVTPPVLTAVLTARLATSGAIITWTTSEPSDTQVEFGPTASYGSSTHLVTTLLTAHDAVLSGLVPGTPCHFRARSRDTAGNLGLSSDGTFTTPGATPPALPIGSWSFSEGSGTVAADASGNGYNGVLVNGPVHAAGVAGGGLSLDGIDDYVDVAAAPALDAFPLTVAAWVKTTDAGLHGVVNKYLPGSLNGYQIFSNGGNLCAWYFRDAADYIWDGSACTLAAPGYTDGRWHHVAFTVDATGGALYVDGALKGTRAWTGVAGPPTTTATLTFGRYPGAPAPYLPGGLDEVRVYNRALSAAEVAALSTMDTTPPVLSGVAASGITTSGATIGWTTNEPSASQVEYGLTAAYGAATPLAAGMVTSHSQAIAALTDGTLYHYRVKSRDGAGNLAASADATFATQRSGG